MFRGIFAALSVLGGFTYRSWASLGWTAMSAKKRKGEFQNIVSLRVFLMQCTILGWL